MNKQKALSPLPTAGEIQNCSSEKYKTGNWNRKGDFMKNINIMKKTFAFLTAAMTFSALATGCGNNNNNSSVVSELSSAEEINNDTIQTQTDNQEETSSASSAETNDTTTSAIKAETIASTVRKTAISDLFSARDLNPDYEQITAEITLKDTTADINGTGAAVNGSVITINSEGVYYITGKLTDGQIIINADKAKVQLVLDNADISCSYSSPIYAVSSDKIFITLADNSTNTLTDPDNYTYSDTAEDEPDACIFSKDSITINGTGTLNVNANYNDGIRSKDDIVITGGTININSAGDGIKGKDYVAVADGNINIKSGQDGIKSTNTEDTSLGFVYVENGNITIDAQQDGIQAETVFTSAGGNFDITAGGGSSNVSKTHTDDFGGGGRMGGDFGHFGGNEDFGGGFGGFGNFSEGTVNYGYTDLAFVQTANNTDSSSDTSSSTKGIKAGSEISIEDGVFSINSSDDTLHSDNTVNITGGNLSLDAGDDGIHADSEINITGGSVNITNSYEGIEAAVINISGGTTELISSDDGFNASDGVTSQGGMGTYVSGVSLNISGGTVYVDAGGDGLDSNGDITISGGTVIVNGPTNSGNGALDSNNEIIVTGGLLIAAGSSGMAERPSEGSSQNSVSCTFDTSYDGGTLVTLLDESGKEILSFAPSKTFQNIVISSPDIQTGASYIFYTGGSSSAENKYGLYVNGG